jgi:hypothetical protein
MRFFSFLLIFLFLISCSGNERVNNQTELPDSTLINQVISAVINIDSLRKDCGIANQIKMLSLYKKIKWDNDSVPSPPPPGGPFSISYDELFSYFNSFKDLKMRSKDSLYITQQFSLSKEHSISNLTSMCFDKNHERYYQFYLPIFSNNNDIAYVLYGLTDDQNFGCYYQVVLKRIHNHWFKILWLPGPIS